jgi:phospholipid N-methyltransferase
MPPDARLLAIERTAEFVERLRGLDDDRFEVVNGCASTIREKLRERGLQGADAVVSGIPFSTLPEHLAGTIVSSVADSLAPGGRFVACQVVATVTRYMNPLLGTPAVGFELLNMPPTRVFTWQKRTASRDA